MENEFNQFINSFSENRDPRADINVSALNKLSGAFLEKAKLAIIDRLEKNPANDDALSLVRAIQLHEATEILKKQLDAIKTEANKNQYNQANTAYTLFELTQNEAYLSDVIEFVKYEGYNEFTRGTYMLRKFTPTLESLTVVWEKYKRGKRIRYPYSWKESCIYYLKENINGDTGKEFFNSLPPKEQQELHSLISDKNSLSLNFRNYMINREDEFTKIGGNPVSGLTLKFIWEGHTGEIHNLCWSENGDFLMSTPGEYSDDNVIKIWSLADAKFKALQRKPEEKYSKYTPLAAVWHNTSNSIITAQKYRSTKDLISIDIVNVDSNKIIETIYQSAEKNSIDGLFFSPEADLIITKTRYESIKSISLSSKRSEEILPDLTGLLESISISPDTKLIAISHIEWSDPETGIEYAYSDRRRYNVSPEILIYSIADKKVTLKIKTDHIGFFINPNISRICWMPNKPILAAGAADNTISIWDTTDGKRISLLEGHYGKVMDLDFSADGHLLVSKSYEDGMLRIWRTDTWQTIAQIREPNYYGHTLAFHPKLPILASLGTENSIRVWEYNIHELYKNSELID